MTALSVGLALACVVLAVVAVTAAARARSAEAALRAGRQISDPPSPPPPPPTVPTRTDEETRSAKALEDVGRTADDLAHGLRDALTAITGRTELLIASLEDDHPGRADAYEIRRLALSAARISKPLRAIGSSHAAAELVDVNLVTSRTAEAFREMLGGHIGVSLALDNRVMRVRIGAAQVQEILLTLAMRARASMPDGGRLTVSTAGHTLHDGQSGPGGVRDFVRIVVADDGRGAPPDGPAASRSAAEEPGAGAAPVGLANVIEVVKQAGGIISIDAIPGAGTTVVVDLPAVTGQTPLSMPSLPRAMTASVLVVEDEPRVRELIKTVLARHGHDVIAVAGPHDGLAVLKRDPSVELMLVDVVMPGMNGYDFATQAQSVAPGLRVVFMSGFARDTTRHPADDRFLAKPFAIDALHDVVQEALGDR